MKLFNFMERAAKEAAEQEAQLHELNCVRLLEKHQLPTTMTPHGLDEMHGYKVEHVVTSKDGKEVHQWKLYKLMDASPKYSIKRVVDVAEA